MSKKIVFMGTPHFAKEVLFTLIQAGYPIVAVVTKQDKPKGRKQELVASEVKQLALQYNIPVLQPQRIRTEYEEVLNYKPDYIITCAYGQIIPKQILDACLCINVHASLLPKYRGGAPMQHAILNNEKQTGITIMTMAEKMDAGDIITQDIVDITPEDTLGTLEAKLIPCACNLLLNTLDLIMDNRATFTKQNEEEVSFAYTIQKEDELLSFEKESYMNLYNHIRALIPNPCAYARMDDQTTYKFHAVRMSDETTTEANGTLLGIIDQAIAIALENKVLLIDEIQPAGKGKMKAKDFMNGAGRKYIGRRFQ